MAKNKLEAVVVAIGTDININPAVSDEKPSKRIRSRINASAVGRICKKQLTIEGQEVASLNSN